MDPGVGQVLEAIKAAPCDRAMEARVVLQRNSSRDQPRGHEPAHGALGTV